MTVRQKKVLFRLLAVGLGIGLALVVGELIARYRVVNVWSAEMRHTMLGDGAKSGRYIYHPVMGYVPRPGYDDHNSLGWRGSEFEVEKPPSTWRIVCLGGSTTYGPTALSAYPAVLNNLLCEEGIAAEVVNAGVPGWTSHENRLNFELRVLSLDPDLVIIYHGRNDLMAQVYNGYENDYSHFRDPTYDFREAANSRASLKRWFKISHLLMLATRAFPEISGFHEAAEHPIFGAVRVEQRPEPSEVLRNLVDRSRIRAFHNNTEAIVHGAVKSGAQVMLATFAFRPEGLKTSHFLSIDPILYKPMAEQLDRNNEVLRKLARKYDLLLAETEVIANHPELFNDDCHVDAAGHAMRADILLETLRASGTLSSVRLHTKRETHRHSHIGSERKRHWTRLTLQI